MNQMIASYRLFFQNYVNFSGRTRRRDYWYVVLVNFVIALVLQLLAQYVAGFFSILAGLYSLAVFIPGIAISFRRLHDTGKSAWWILLCLVPVIGSIVVLIFFCMDSQPGANQYGPNPKEH